MTPMEAFLEKPTEQLHEPIADEPVLQVGGVPTTLVAKAATAAAAAPIVPVVFIKKRNSL